MKRVTISISDTLHAAITKYATSKGVSFSKASSHLAGLGLTSKPTDELATDVSKYLRYHGATPKLLIKDFSNRVVNIPESTLNKGIESALMGFEATQDHSDPLAEFHDFVAALED